MGAKKLISRKIFVLAVLGLFIISSTHIYLTKGMPSYNTIYNLKKLDESEQILSYYPQSHDFGDMYEGEINSTTFEVWNSGCCILYYQFDWNCSWIDVYPTGGVSINNQHDTINISINTTGLETGLNTCNIKILSNGGNAFFPVTVNILHCQIINISIIEAWEKLNSTDNGIQNPIDLRSDEEWKNEHIDTPKPENPRHHPIEEIINETKLEEFLSLYKYKTILIYDNSGESSNIAAQILYDINFKGLVLKMEDGINAWKEAGYPVIANIAPEKPTITGPTDIKKGVEYNFTFVATDPEQDYLFYEIHWGDTKVDLVGPYKSGEIVKSAHTWSNTIPNGNYSIGTLTIDRYGDKSEWSFQDIKIIRNKIKLHNTYLFREILIILNKFININKYIIN